jgi:hypothetical protein
MYYRNKDAWHGLVYTLLYPAILGSMLYDLFFFSNFELWKYLSQVIIVLIYLVDYIFLYNDLLPSAQARAIEMVADGLVALLFRAAFAALIYGKLPLSAGFLFVISLIYFFYAASRHPLGKKFVLFIAGILLINLALSLILKSYSITLFALGAFIFLIVYIFFTFYYAPKYAAQQNKGIGDIG